MANSLLPSPVDVEPNGHFRFGADVSPSLNVSPLLASPVFGAHVSPGIIQRETPPPLAPNEEDVAAVQLLEMQPSVEINEAPIVGLSQISAQARDARCRRQWRSKEIRERALLLARQGKPVAYVCRTLNISRTTFNRWEKDFFEERRTAPVPRIGRQRKLSLVDVEKLLEKLGDDPTITNMRLRTVPDVAVHPSTIGRYLKRANITRKKISDDSAPLFDARILSETREFYRFIQSIPWSRRVYVDESFVYDNEAQSMGRSVRGQRIYRGRERYGKRWTMYFAIRSDGMAHPPILRKANANDAEFLAYVRDTLAPCLSVGDVVLWDRLGRSGRAKNPCKQHYNPQARDMIERKGATVAFLPPKGKYFNPIELAFGTLKEFVRASYAMSVAATEKRPRTEAELCRVVVDATCSMMREENVFAGYFRECADGRGFANAFPNEWTFISAA